MEDMIDRDAGETATSLNDAQGTAVVRAWTSQGEWNDWNRSVSQNYITFQVEAYDSGDTVVATAWSDVTKGIAAEFVKTDYSMMTTNLAVRMMMMILSLRRAQSP